MRKFAIVLLIGIFVTVITACSANSDQAAENSSGNGEISGDLTVFGWGGGEELQSRKEATKIFKNCIQK